MPYIQGVATGLIGKTIFFKRHLLRAYQAYQTQSAEADIPKTAVVMPFDPCKLANGALQVYRLFVCYIDETLAASENSEQLTSHHRSE